MMVEIERQVGKFKQRWLDRYVGRFKQHRPGDMQIGRQVNTNSDGEIDSIYRNSDDRE